MQNSEGIMTLSRINTEDSQPMQIDSMMIIRNFVSECNLSRLIIRLMLNRFSLSNSAYNASSSSTVRILHSKRPQELIFLELEYLLSTIKYRIFLHVQRVAILNLWIIEDLKNKFVEQH